MMMIFILLGNSINRFKFCKIIENNMYLKFRRTARPEPAAYAAITETSISIDDLIFKFPVNNLFATSTFNQAGCNILALHLSNIPVSDSAS